jgi:hypothetical protein
MSDSDVSDEFDGDHVQGESRRSRSKCIIAHTKR